MKGKKKADAEKRAADNQAAAEKKKADAEKRAAEKLATPEGKAAAEKKKADAEKKAVKKAFKLTNTPCTPLPFPKCSHASVLIGANNRKSTKTHLS